MLGIKTVRSRNWCELPQWQIWRRRPPLRNREFGSEREKGFFRDQCLVAFLLIVVVFFWMLFYHFVCCQSNKFNFFFFWERLCERSRKGNGWDQFRFATLRNVWCWATWPGACGPFVFTPMGSVRTENVAETERDLWTWAVVPRWKLKWIIKEENKRDGNK